MRLGVVDDHRVGESKLGLKKHVTSRAISNLHKSDLAPPSWLRAVACEALDDAFGRSLQRLPLITRPLLVGSLGQLLQLVAQYDFPALPPFCMVDWKIDGYHAVLCLPRSQL
jgi:hypothetical protein